MITKSGVFAFRAPNIIVCGPMDSGKRIPVPEIQERSCSHRVRVTLHEVNKSMIVSLCNLHRKHNGLAAILNLNNFSFRYRILFSILYWNERNDDSIVTCLGSIQTLSSQHCLISTDYLKTFALLVVLLCPLRVSGMPFQR